MSRAEWSMKQAGTNAAIERRDSSAGHWYDGEVATPHGFVIVYSEQTERGGFSSYRAVVNGRLHMMSEGKMRGPRGLAIVAARWIRELCQP